jgi:hypothetical protein
MKMNARLKLAAAFLPRRVKEKRLRQLFQLTAQAFQTEMPDIGSLSFSECLRIYGLYSSGEAEKVIARGDEQSVRSRLYGNAFWLGGELRKALRPRTMQEFMTAAAILYGAIGIDLQGDTEGHVLIRRCFFSRYYSRRICELMSSVDQGILAGLSDGGELRFIQRLTEGKDCCKAEFVPRDRPE